MKASELIGSSLLVLSKAEMCGTVSGIVPSNDLKRIETLEILCDDDDDCEKKYVSVKKILAIENGVVTIKYPDSMVMCCVLPELASPINLPAYNEEGKLLGVITDVEMDGYQITALIINDARYTLSEILTRSSSLIVFRNPLKKTRITKNIKRVPNAKKPSEQIVKIDTVVKHLRYQFLLGRTLSGDVTDTAGGIVAKDGSTITEEIIDTAKKCGAIARLAIAARK